MDSQHKVGTNPWNEAAVPVVWSGTHHQRIGQGTGRRAPETRQAAHGGACGSPGGVQRNGRAGMDDGRAALMCSCLKESRVRARPGTSREEGTLPRGDRLVLRPRLNWEGGAAWND